MCVVFARRARVVSDARGRCALVLNGVPGGSAFASSSARGSIASLYGRHTLLNWFIMWVVSALASRSGSVAFVQVFMNDLRWAGASPVMRSWLALTMLFSILLPLLVSFGP